MSRTTGIGTVAYASPEQLRKDIYDQKTDIYSLGIIFFELYYPFYTKMERSRVLDDLRNKRFLPVDFSKNYPKEVLFLFFIFYLFIFILFLFYFINLF